MTATASFAAVAMQDGSVNVYTSTGRRSVSSHVPIPYFLIMCHQINAYTEPRISVLGYGVKQECAHGGDILGTTVFLVTFFCLRC